MEQKQSFKANELQHRFSSKADFVRYLGEIRRKYCLLFLTITLRVPHAASIYDHEGLP